MKAAIHPAYNRDPRGVVCPPRLPANNYFVITHRRPSNPQERSAWLESCSACHPFFSPVSRRVCAITTQKKPRLSCGAFSFPFRRKKRQEPTQPRPKGRRRSNDYVGEFFHLHKDHNHKTIHSPSLRAGGPFPLFPLARPRKKITSCASQLGQTKPAVFFRGITKADLRARSPSRTSQLRPAVPKSNLSPRHRTLPPWPAVINRTPYNNRLSSARLSSAT